MPKLFVVSDVHSFYKPLKKALDETGFDPKDENHWLISCGDAFDRGPDSEDVLHYLMNLERKVLVKGNHDILLKDLCLRGFPYSHDKSNGTVRTVWDIAKGEKTGDSFDKCCDITYKKTSRYREQLVNYFETENYIFVHGWIPCLVHSKDPTKPWYQFDKEYRYKPDWRSSSDIEWEDAMWINGIARGLEGVLEPGKTIVCGHWHCSAGYTMRDGYPEFEKGAVWEPFYHDGMIAIDRCTAHTGEVNVLVLEDEFIDK